MNRFLVALWVLAVIAGCGKKKSCKADVDELMTFLRTLDMEGSPLYIDDQTHLATREGLPRARQLAPVVNVTANITTYQGVATDGADLAERLAEANQKLRDAIAEGRVPKRDPPDPTLIYYQIDADATWGRVVTAATAGTEAGFTHASFAFTLPVTQKPPPRTWVDDKLDELRAKQGKDGGNVASELAKVTRGIVQSCPALVRVYGAVGSEEGGNKAVTLVEGTGPALIDCNCDIDIPALRSVMWGILGNPHPVGALPVQLAKGGKPIELPAATPWREANKRLAAGDVAWLVAK